MFQQAGIFCTFDSSLSSIFSADSVLIWHYLLLSVIFLFSGIDAYLILFVVNF